MFWKKGLRRIFGLNWEKDEDGENYINNIFECFALHRNLLRYSSGMEARPLLESSVRNRKPKKVRNALKTRLRPIMVICRKRLLMNFRSLQKCWRMPSKILLSGYACLMSSKKAILTFRHRASCILGQAFHYSPENAFNIFNQQIYLIIWYLLDRASLI